MLKTHSKSVWGWGVIFGEYKLNSSCMLMKGNGFFKFLYLVIPERSSLSFVEVFTDITQPFLDVYKYFAILV